MKLTQRQIAKIKKAHEKAHVAEMAARTAQAHLCALITEFTGVEGIVDHFQDDGFGFTPINNDDCHIGIPELIKFAEDGIDITEDFINDNLMF